MTKPAKPPRMTPAKALRIICAAAKHAPWYITHNKEFDDAMRRCRELARILKPKDD